jgi:hypothetical protein
MVGYALALARSSVMGQSDPAEAERARSLAEQAHRRAPHLAEPALVLAGLHFNAAEGVAAARELRSALLAAPACVDAQEMCGRMLIELGRIEKGASLLEVALLAEPRLSRSRYDLARGYALGGQRAKAEAIFRAPPAEGPESSLYWLGLARHCLVYSDVGWARSVRPRLEGLEFDFKAQTGRLFDLVLGDHAAGEYLCQSLDDYTRVTRMPRTCAYYGQLAVEILLAIGDTAGALDRLEAADRYRFFDVAWLEACPLLEAIRGEPRFHAVRANTTRRAAEILAVLDPNA